MTTLLFGIFIIIPSFITIAFAKYNKAPLKLDPDLKSLSFSLIFSEVPFVVSFFIVGIICFLFFDFNFYQPIIWITSKDYVPTYIGIAKWSKFFLIVYIIQIIFVITFVTFLKTLIAKKNTSNIVMKILDSFDILDDMKMMFNSDRDISIDIKQGNFIYVGTFDKSIRNWFGKNVVQLEDVFKIEEKDAVDTIENLIKNKKINSSTILPKMIFDFDKVENINIQLNSMKNTPLNVSTKKLVADKLKEHLIKKQSKSKTPVD